MDKILHVLSDASGFLLGHRTGILSVLGVLFTIAKAISTEKAPRVVAMVQACFDSIARVLTQAGQLVQSASELMAGLIQSDGTLGAK